MPRAHVEPETDEHRDDRRPPEQDTDLNGDRTEAELERRVALARGASAERDGGTLTACKRPEGRRVVGHEARQDNPIQVVTTVGPAVVPRVSVALPTQAGG